MLADAAVYHGYWWSWTFCDGTDTLEPTALSMSTPIPSVESLPQKPSRRSAVLVQLGGLRRHIPRLFGSCHTVNGEPTINKCSAPFVQHNYLDVNISWAVEHFSVPSVPRVSSTWSYRRMSKLPRYSICRRTRHQAPHKSDVFQIWHAL